MYQIYWAVGMACAACQANWNDTWWNASESAVFVHTSQLDELADGVQAWHSCIAYTPLSFRLAILFTCICLPYPSLFLASLNAYVSITHHSLSSWPFFSPQSVSPIHPRAHGTTF